MLVIPVGITSCSAQQQRVSGAAAGTPFVEHLITGKPLTADTWMAPETRQVSRRLGINYVNVPQKALIQYDVEAGVRRAIQQDGVTYSLREESLEDGFSRVDLSVPEREYRRSFYFHEGKLVTPVQYFSRNWQRERTRYFEYRISNPANFNRQVAVEMRAFVMQMLDDLQIDEPRRQQLEQEKILYLICDSPEEIEQVTGFNTRGIYILGIDAIVSQFNAHFHEVAHLLINYKLGQLPLYTHPFLQEGFASAVGGRGDKSVDVTLDLGRFLHDSAFLSYTELLKTNDFHNQDASLSYPVSAVYNRFLLDELGMARYLDFYRRNSRTTDINASISSSQLPPDSLFRDWLSRQTGFNPIFFPEMPGDAAPLLDAHWGSVWEREDAYLFHLRGSIRLTPPNPPKAFASKEFREIFPDVRYAGERYVLSVADAEVKLFDFYTAKLQAIYAHGLSLEQHPVRTADGYFQFAIRKSAFPLPLTDYLISQ